MAVVSDFIEVAVVDTEVPGAIFLSDQESRHSPRAITGIDDARLHHFLNLLFGCLTLSQKQLLQSKADGAGISRVDLLE